MAFTALKSLYWTSCNHSLSLSLSLPAIVFSDQIKVYNVLVSSVSWNKSKQYLISVIFYFFLVNTFSNVWPLPVHFLIETNNKTKSLLQKLFRPSGTWISLTKTNYIIKLLYGQYIFINIYVNRLIHWFIITNTTSKYIYHKTLSLFS